MMRIVLLILLSYYSVMLQAQEKSIVLSKEIGYGPFLRLSRPVYPSESKYLTIPDTLKLKHLMFYKFDLYPEGEIYRDFKHGIISSSEFNEEIQYFTSKSIDTALLNKFIETRNSRLYFFSAIGFNGKHYIGYDNNYNGKIDVGEMLIYDRETVESLKKNDASDTDMLPNIKLYESEKKHELNVKIIPLPYFDSYDNEVEMQTAFYIHLNEFWKAKQEKDIFYARQDRISTYHNTLVIKDNLHLDIQDRVLKKSQSYYHEDSEIFFKDYKIIGETLLLYISYRKKHLNDRGRYFDYNLVKISDKKVYNLKKYLNKKKFILLDFWGSWCVPCINNISDLKRIQALYGDKLQVVGIAYDDSINIVKSTIMKHNITWDNFLLNRWHQSKMLEQVEVLNFPTYLLFKEDGELLKSWSGKINNDDLSELLK